MAHTDPIRFPSREVMAMGAAMRITRPVSFPRRSPGPRGPVTDLLHRRCRRVRAQAENTSQSTMPVTMIPTVPSGLWGGSRSSRPSTAQARTTCSSSSVNAGGRTSPAP